MHKYKYTCFGKNSIGFALDGNVHHESWLCNVGLGYSIFYGHLSHCLSFPFKCSLASTFSFQGSQNDGEAIIFRVCALTAAISNPNLFLKVSSNQGGHQSFMKAEESLE